MLLNSFVGGIYDPVLPDATSFVSFPFVESIVLCCAGGEDLNNQVGSAVYAIGLNFVSVTNYHKIRNKFIYLVQVKVIPISKGYTFFLFK